MLAWALAAVSCALALLVVRELHRRRELVARACHELRGPLTALRLVLDTIERRGEAPPERVALLGLELRRAGLALDDFAAARDGHRTADRDEPIEIAELLEQQWAGWHVVATAFHSAVLLRGTLPGAIVRGDRLRLAQAVSNLVANALEHAPGTIVLNARLVAPRIARIEVVDEGPGLPAALRDITRRPRAGRGRRGRGLAIAAGIAERHGGRLVAADGPRGGASIGLELPSTRERA